MQISGFCVSSEGKQAKRTDLRSGLSAKEGKNMILEDKWFTLKDGRRAVIRTPKEEDIEGMLNYLRVSAEETEFILRYPEECSKYTYENEQKVFAQWRESENDLALVCVVDGEVAGNCHVRINTNLKTRHRASIGIALMKKYWNLGIGTLFFEEMIAFAKAKPQVTQIELEFIEGNTRARALYEKMGFRIYGVRPNAIKLKDGRLLNEYLMIKEL